VTGCSSCDTCCRGPAARKPHALPRTLYVGRRDDVAHFPADARVSPFALIGATLAFAGPRPCAAAAKFVPPLSFAPMATSGARPLTHLLADLVEAYQRNSDLGALMDAVAALAKQHAAAEVKDAVHPYQALPEVVIPAYEALVARADADAQSMVVLANAYWLTGRGTDAVERLAMRARTLDAGNRGAWHLWALAHPEVRGRVDRWRQVVATFPGDHLARAALADNATSLANDEHDPVALRTAIDTYAGLLAETVDVHQRMALESTLQTLKGWQF
jgi:hypothetical protein